MKLYFHPFSPNARIARMTAALLGIDLELKLVDLVKGEQNAPEYRALNPNGMVPTLDDNKFILWESNAIAQYLASKKTKPDLFPTDPKVRADISRWQYWDLAHWMPATRTIAFERMFKKMLKAGEPDAVAVDRAIGDFHRFATVLDGHLGGREHLAGKTLTLADLSVGARLMYAASASYPVEKYRNIQRWFASLQALDAWKLTDPQMAA